MLLIQQNADQSIAEKNMSMSFFPQKVKNLQTKITRRHYPPLPSLVTLPPPSIVERNKGKIKSSFCRNRMKWMQFLNELAYSKIVDLNRRFLSVYRRVGILWNIWLKQMLLCGRFTGLPTGRFTVNDAPVSRGNMRNAYAENFGRIMQYREVTSYFKFGKIMRYTIFPNI